MDTAKKVGLTLFVSAWFFLAATLFFLQRIGEAQQVPTSDFLFFLLIILSGTVLSSRYIDRTRGLKRRGRLAMVLVVVVLLLVFLAPAVRTLPSDGGYGTVCRGSVCSNVTQWVSLTAYYFCWGGSYSYDTIDGLVLGLEVGCPGAIQ